jgi:hypothetical protein
MAFEKVAACASKSRRTAIWAAVSVVVVMPQR